MHAIPHLKHPPNVPRTSSQVVMQQKTLLIRVLALVNLVSNLQIAVMVINQLLKAVALFVKKDNAEPPFSAVDD